MEPQNISSNNFFGIKVSQPNINVNTAANNQLIMQDDYSTRIYYDPSGVPHVILGLRGANANNGLSQNEQGLYVSKEGIDVTNATDAQLIFNSQQDVFKIVSSGNITNTVGGTLAQAATNTTTTPHGLSFTPAIMGFINGSGSSYLTAGVFYQTPYVASSWPTGAVNIHIIYSFTVDATNIYTNIYNGGNVGVTSIGSTVFKYYLLQETAE